MSAPRHFRCLNCQCEIKHGRHCHHCFNWTFRRSKCTLCNESIWIRECMRDTHPNWNVCRKCDNEHSIECTCCSCGKPCIQRRTKTVNNTEFICPDCAGAPPYNYKRCECTICHKEQALYRGDVPPRTPICWECKDRNHVLRKCITCGEEKKFYKYRNPERCQCTTCYWEAKNSK